MSAPVREEVCRFGRRTVSLATVAVAVVATVALAIAIAVVASLPALFFIAVTRFLGRRPTFLVVLDAILGLRLVGLCLGGRRSRVKE